jgi:uncharacterized protein YdaL
LVVIVMIAVDTKAKLLGSLLAAEWNKPTEQKTKSFNEPVLTSLQ